jgi:EmrB/QacA subfamily drug resistance transporter
VDDVERLGIDAPGADEVVVVPWPLLFRQRVAARVERSDRYRWWVLAVALLGVWSVSFTITILSVSLARIARDLRTDVPTITWVITGPMLAYGVVGPLLGKAGDVWGYRHLFVFGLVGSIVFAALSALAWDATSLIVFRVLGVAEGAATGPASMALIMRAFPDEDRVKAMGWWSLVGAGAPVIGVVAGGPIVEQFGWRPIFVAQVPFTIVALVLALLVLPETERRASERLDWAGVVTLGAGMTALLFAVNRGPSWGWSHPVVLAGLLVAPGALLAFVMVERAAPSPLVPLEWLRRRNFSLPIAVQFFTNFAYMGSFFLTPLFLVQAFHYGETRAGLLTIGRPAAFALTAPIAGYLAVKVGERTAAIAGSAFVIASMLVWTRVSPGASDAHVIGALALAGVGLGVSSPSLAASIANAVEDAKLGIAGAAQQLIAQVGQVVGIQVAETIQASRAGAGLTASFHDAYFTLGLVCTMGLVCSAFVQSTPRGALRRSRGVSHFEAA